jgi:predicted RNA-binding Zn-ribbon protein involved in translation (DUF1610 family)
MSANEEKICCPKCSWEPDGHAYWTCSCGISWNTFETYGKCPGCGKIWRDTQCPECVKWSPHADWYIDLPAIELEKEQTATNAQT